MKVLAACLLALLAVSPLRADERLFGFVYEAEVLPKGGVEFEQWITNANGHDQGVYSRFDLAEEVETGLTDNLTASLYFKAKSIYSSLKDRSGGADNNTEEFSFEGLATEWKYRLLSPHTHWLGALGYAEFAYNGPEFEAEAKLVLQHNFSDDLVWAFNVAAENEYVYEASRQGSDGILELSTGLSYRLSPAFSLALEAKQHSIWPDAWSVGQHDGATFVGPSIHTAADKWWATFSVMPQIIGWPETIPGDGRDLVNHERVESRLVFGVNF